MSDALARPYDPFEITPRFAWVECPLADYAGFSIHVRANLRNRDRKILMDLIGDVDAEAKRLGEAAQKKIKKFGDKPDGAALVALIEEMNRLQDENRIRIPDAIAPYVVGWNLEEVDTETGERVDLPPPSAIGADAFENVEQPMLDWIVGSIVMAYRGGKGFPTSLPTRDGSAEQPSASTETTSTEPNPESDSDPSQPSPETSPTP